ncbi:hypothetical protein GCM10020219_024500 [Nonomuraea dietziae]
MIRLVTRSRGSRGRHYVVQEHTQTQVLGGDLIDWWTGGGRIRLCKSLYRILSSLVVACCWCLSIGGRHTSSRSYHLDRALVSAGCADTLDLARCFAGGSSEAGKGAAERGGRGTGLYSASFNL